MSRSRKNPVKHVISFRVTEHEKELLNDMAEESGVNISILLRERLHLVSGHVPGKNSRKVDPGCKGSDLSWKS